MENKAMEYITKKVETVLAEQGYIRVKGEDNQNEVAFIGESAAYMITYNPERKVINLKTSAVVDGEPDNSWKNLSVWSCDQEVDSSNQFESIANDFCDTLGSPSQKAKVLANAKKSKKKKDDDDSVTPVFFIKRFAHIIPEIREEWIRYAEIFGEDAPFNFVRVHVSPKLVELLSTEKYTPIQAKIVEALDHLYKMGDLDVKSIITMLILNQIEDESARTRLYEELGDELKKTMKPSLKFKNKTVKPEKPKKKTFMQKMMEQNPGTINR